MREPGSSSIHTTRLAPSPTGSLHLGNAFAFVVNWAMARKMGWRIILRIEDLDVSRVHAGMIEDCIETLRWLGLDWDGEPLIQSRAPDRFARAMGVLCAARRVYPCELSRREIQEALSAPHEGHGGGAGFQTIRPRIIPEAFTQPQTSWRFIPDEEPVIFEDACMGPQRFGAGDLGGDFIVWTKRQAPSYQLGVVVDDHAAGVDRVVRGRDLLDSAARQLMLSRALGYHDEPEYTHLPLVMSEGGRRLAKRDQDTHIRSYSGLGGPERVIGLIACWCGLTGERAPMSVSRFLDAFDPDTLPADDCVFREEDARWLRS